MLHKTIVILSLIFSLTLALPAWANENVVGHDRLSGLNGPAQQEEGIKVQRVDFPVVLSDGNSYTIAGYLYYRGDFEDRTLQVVMHGGTYNHKYWDAPSINAHPYSYARFMAEHHYAVLALDQLGTGDSSKPDGDFVTLAETTSALHQVLVQLRSGSNPLGYAFVKIVLVGHSFGSLNAVYVQANYHDADALVVTGYGHVPHELPFTDELIAELAQYPYFTLPPEVRAAVFYNGTAADQAVIDYDNSNLTDLLTRGQLFTTVGNLQPYEQEMYQNTGLPISERLGERERIEQNKPWLNTYLKLVSYKDAANGGRGGIQEVRTKLQALSDKHGLPIKLVVLDWAGDMVFKNLEGRGETAESGKMSLELQQLVNRAKYEIGARFGAVVWIPHQLQGRYNDASPTWFPHHNKAQWCSTFADHAWYAFVLGTKDKEHNVCQFGATKTRHGETPPPIILKVDGAWCRMRDVSDSYQIDRISGQLAPISDVSRFYQNQDDDMSVDQNSR